MISDLHLGAGPDDPLEDFSPVDDEIFDAWVRAIAGPGVTLFLNGDFIDFAQILATTEPSLPSHLLWTEADSREKFAVAFAAHRRCFDALGAFVTAGGTIHVLVGNHDFDLDWPGVRADFTAAVGGTRQNVMFTTGAHVHAGVHIEHGYQFSPENCPRDPVRFRHEHDGTQYLERVWGTDFLLSYLNGIKASAPYADKVKPPTQLAYHGFKKRWIPRRQLLSIVIFLRRRGVPWGALASVMDGGSDPIDGVYGAFAGDEWRGLIADLLDDPAERAALEEAISQMDADEVAMLQRREIVDVGLDAELRDDPGAVSQTMALWREPRETRAATERLAADGVTHVVFGHTHRIVDGALDGRHFNPGTWNAHLDLREPEVAARIRAEGGLTKAMLSDPSLYRTDRKAVLIESQPSGAPARVSLIPVS